MSPSLTPSRQSEVSHSIPVGIAPDLRWRIAVLRGIAAALVVAGAVELLQVAGNFVMKIPYTGGPLALPGALTVVIARFLATLAVFSPADLDAFNLRSQWMVPQAQTTGSFLGVMMAAHIGLGGLDTALGYGLWRRQPWARWLAVSVLGLSGFVTVAHGVALLWVGGIWRGFGIVASVLALIIVPPILLFLISPRTGLLFLGGNGSAVAPRRRRWWMLSLQWTAALLVLALACALVLLVGLGPMVEVVWIAAEATAG